MAVISIILGILAAIGGPSLYDLKLQQDLKNQYTVIN